jgi:hypothetical protein
VGGIKQAIAHALGRPGQRTVIAPWRTSAVNLPALAASAVATATLGRAGVRAHP